MSNTDFEDLRSAEEANELEEKRQTLHVLVATGSEKKYIGVSLTPARVNKLSEKEVNRYFDLYKIGLGRDTANSLIKSGVGLMVSGLSKLVNVNDPEGLKEELCEDELLRKELQELAGTAIVKGGRLVCLLSLGFRVLSHTLGDLKGDAGGGKYVGDTNFGTSQGGDGFKSQGRGQTEAQERIGGVPAKGQSGPGGEEREGLSDGKDYQTGIGLARTGFLEYLNKRGWGVDSGGEPVLVAEEQASPGVCLTHQPATATEPSAAAASPSTPGA